MLTGNRPQMESRLLRSSKTQYVICLSASPGGNLNNQPGISPSAAVKSPAEDLLLFPLRESDLAWNIPFLLLITPCPTFFSIKTFHFVQLLRAPSYLLHELLPNSRST